MRKLALTAVVFLASALVQADTIYLKETGLKLDGKILRETDDFIILLVYNETGQVRVPRSKIEKIEYDINKQIMDAGDDNGKKYKIALWALGKGMFADAIKIFESLKGKDGVEPDMLKLLAQTYEKRGQKDKALQTYKEYAPAHPEDTEVAARITALTKEMNPDEATTDPQVKQAPQGLEKDGNWVAEKWPDANTCTLQITTDPNTGHKTVCVQQAGGPDSNKDKTAFSRAGDPLNLSESKSMMLRVYIKDCPVVNMALAFTNAQGKFYESRQKRVASNSWVPVEFDIQAKDFKTEDANHIWEFKYALDGKERITKIFFLVYGQRPFTMYVDSVFFSKL